MDRLAVAGPLSRRVFAGCVLVSLVVLFTPAQDVPAAAPGVDKFVHLLLFAALAIAGRWAGLGARPLAVVLVGYAALSEVVQAATPLARTGSVDDLLADLAGIVLGLVAWSTLRRTGAPGSLGR